MYIFVQIIIFWKLLFHKKRHVKICSIVELEQEPVSDFLPSESKLHAPMHGAGLQKSRERLTYLSNNVGSILILDKNNAELFHLCHSTYLPSCKNNPLHKKNKNMHKNVFFENYYFLFILRGKFIPTEKNYLISFVIIIWCNSILVFKKTERCKECQKK
jgi:hypothetical protein